MDIENMTPRRALELAVIIEELGAQFYRAVAKKLADQPEIANVFSCLAMDETAHEAEFDTLLRGLADETGTDGDLESDAAVYPLLRTAAMSEFFHADALGDLTEIEDRRDALIRAIGFEKSTVRFYLALEEVIGESPELTALIAAEKRHVATLMRVVVSEAEFRGLADADAVV